MVSLGVRLPRSCMSVHVHGKPALVEPNAETLLLAHAMHQSISARLRTVSEHGLNPMDGGSDGGPRHVPSDVCQSIPRRSATAARTTCQQIAHVSASGRSW